jgi:hypothetical protein
MSELINRLSEGVIRKTATQENDRLLAKWGKTGLLEGLRSDKAKVNLAVLLENQVKEVIKEATTMSGGDVEGFATNAFPLVRRVYGNIVATELVSVQPLSHPTGLIFFMDYKYTNSRLSKVAGESVFGQGVVGYQISGGVLLDALNNESSFYAQSNGYTSPTASFTATTLRLASGTVGVANSGSNVDVNTLVQFDRDLEGSVVAVATIPLSELTTATNLFSGRNFVSIELTGLSSSLAAYKQVHRHTKILATDPTKVQFVIQVLSGSHTKDDAAAALDAVAALTAPIKDNFTNVGQRALGALVGTDSWGLENNADIPELDMSIDSVSIDTESKKLRVKWTPELGQDMQAYHGIDAEVELTQAMSRHIEQEIDSMILEDLIKGGTAALKFWSRSPGKFVNRDTGADVSNTTSPPDFTGNVSEWYQTLIETVNEVSAAMYRKIVAGAANFLVCGPEIANILEMTSGFAANITVGEDKGQAGTLNIGSVSRKFETFVTPYIHKNLILVGRKGSEFLESGYVYAPYIPLQMTPLILDPESFTPRKGLLTRFGRKMVRPDFYGIVIVMDL